jgi:hypothetical protein
MLTKSGDYRYPRISVGMVDRDVIERVAAIWGVSVQRHKPYGVSRQVQYRAWLSGERSLAVMRALYPLMGARRRAQIDAVLEHEAARGDPNEARRAWSSEAMSRRERDERGRLKAR